MKNIHKIRGKREFLFDDKELIVLSSGAVIIAGLIFILGFLVGQGVQQHTMASSLSPADSFADTALVEEGITTALAPEDASQESADKKKGQVGYYRVLPDKGEYVQVEVTPSKSGATAPALAEQQPEAAVPDVSSAPQARQEPTPAEPDPASAPAGSRPAAVAPSVLPNVPKSPGDEMYVGRPGSTTISGGAMLTGVGYSVQVASSPRLEESERLRQKFIALGYDAYIKQANVPDKGLWYRVFVGNFSAKEDAERLRRELLAQASHLTKDAYVARNTD